MHLGSVTVFPHRRNILLLRPRGKAILGAAMIFAAAGLSTGHDLARLTFLLSAAVLGLVALWIWLAVRNDEAADKWMARAVARMAADDPVPVVLTGRNRVILYANAAAGQIFDADTETLLTGVFDGEIANAGPFLFDLEQEAVAQGAAQAYLPRIGNGLTLSVHRAGQERFVWRIVLEPPGEDEIPQADVPVIRVDEGGTILEQSPAADELFNGSFADLDALCANPPLRPGQINTIRTEAGEMPCQVAEWPRQSGRRDIYLFPDTKLAQAQPDGVGYFEALPVPLLKLCWDGMIMLSNQPARALLGVESGEGRRIGDLLEGPGRPMADWLEDAAAGRGTVRPEIVRVRREDRETYVQVTLTPASGQGGKELIAVLNDATRFKSLEEQFAQSQKMQAIGQLAGGVAHDFNNLLTAISGHCDLLLLRHDQGDGDYADLMQISQNANRAAALVSQLLAYSRKQTLRPETMDLRDVLSDLTHLLNRLVGEKVTLSVRNDPDLWAVRADKRQLEQVLMNLVVNARDAMPKGGDIRIRTENRLLREPMTRNRATVAPGRYVAIEVVDEGVGIPPDRLEKVFEPFFTSKRPGEGTGLGLSTVYGIMKQTGGFIFADSKPGEGASFLLLLPAHDAVAQAPRAAAPVAQADTRSEGVVLLVEGRSTCAGLCQPRVENAWAISA